MRIPHPALLAACLALSACGGGGGGGPPPCVAGAACTPSSACSVGEVRCEASGPACVATAPRPDGTACGEGATCSGGACLRTVTVTAVDRYMDDAGNVVAVPRAALGQSTFRALVLGADGSYQAYPGSLAAPGVVEIPGVPVGTCLVEQKLPGSTTVPSFTEISGNVFDDSYDHAGRPGAARSTLPTRIELQATGLAPWQVGWYPEDRFQVVSSNLGDGVELWEPGVPAGATEASILPWDGWPNGVPLFDGAVGDRVQVVQLGRVDGPVPYLAAVRSGTLPETFTVADGVGQIVPIALGPIESTRTLEVDWAFGEMEALLGEMGPGGGQLRSRALVVSAQPHGLLPDMTVLEVPVSGPGSGTLPIGPFTYGRPYPDFFAEVASASMSADVEVALAPPSSERIYTDATVNVWLGSPTAGRILVRPAVSPPWAVRVSGLDVGVRIQRDLGTTPSISWSPPSIGTAVLYRITLHRVIDGGSPFSLTVARFTTPSTELRVPAGILFAGANYYARLTAISESGTAQTVTASFVP